MNGRLGGGILNCDWLGYSDNLKLLKNKGFFLSFFLF